MKDKIDKINDYINIIMIAIFVIARILRNSFFYYTTEKGGIWNYISLYFLLQFIYLFIIKNIFIKKTIKKTHLIFYFYIFYIWILNIYQVLIYNQNTYINIYKMFMFPFFIYIFIISYYKKINIYILSKYYSYIFYIVTVINIISFILFYKKILQFVMVSNVYYSLCLFPYTLINKKKIDLKSFFLMGICLILSNKRAGVVAFILCFFSLFVFSSKKIKKQILSIIICSICLGNIIFFGFKEEIQNIRLFKRITISQMIKDKGSNRLDIYKKIINDYSNLELDKKILGTYQKDIEKNTGHDNVHNDFLEILYTKGMISLVIFILIYFYYFIVFFKMQKKNFLFKGIYLFILNISLILSMLSVYFIDFGYSIVGAGLIGYLISEWENKKEQKWKIENIQ